MTADAGRELSSARGTMRRIGSLSLVYGMGMLFNKAVAFMMLPVYTRLLTPADYGVLALIDTTMEVVSIVAGSRLTAGIFHFYHKADTPSAKNEVLSSALVVLVTAFTVAGATAFTLAPSIAQLVFGSQETTGLLRIAALSLALQSLLFVPMSYLQLVEQSRLFVVVNSTKLVIQLILNLVLLVGFQMGVRAVLLSSLVANLVIGSGVTVMLARRVGLGFSWEAARNIVRFGLPFIGTHLANFLLTFGDRYVLQAVAGTAVVGVYGLAYQFGFLFAALGDGPYSAVWAPMRFKVANRPDRDAVYARAFIHLNLWQVTLGVVISLFVPEFLRVAATPPFYQAGSWVPVIVAAYLFQSWGYFLNTGLFITERTGLITWASWLGAFAAVAGYLALIPWLGGLGAALGTLLALLVLFWTQYRYSQREWPVAYQWGPVVRLLGAAVAVCGGAYLVPPVGLPLAVAAKCALFAVYVAAVWSLGVLAESEREVVWLAVRNPMAALRQLRR